MSERRFDEKDVARIIQRATEIQSGTLPGDEHGVTLAEIQRVAAEIGIDPATVAAAAEDVTGGSRTSLPDKSNPFHLDETVDGEMDDELWDECVSKFRAASGQPGTVNVAAGRYEWTGGTEFRGMTVTVTVRKGRSRVRLLGQTQNATVVIWTLCIAFGLIATLATGGILSRLGNPGTVVAACLGVAATFTTLAIVLDKVQARSAAGRFAQTLSFVRAMLVGKAMAPRTPIVSTDASTATELEEPVPRVSS